MKIFHIKTAILSIMFILATGQLSFGDNWHSINTGTSMGLWGIDFISTNTGWVVGEGGVIRRTSNEGLNWTVQNSGTSSILYSVDFLNENFGIAVGDERTILRTTNGGTNWTRINIGLGDKLRRVQIVSENLIFAVGDPGNVFKSTNGGLTWENKSTMFNGGIKGIDFTSNSNGYVVGLSGSVFKTSNTGTDWNLVNIPVMHTLEEIDFINPDNGIAVGYEAAIYKISEGVWNNITTPYSNWLFDVEYLNENIVYAVGSTGALLKSTNGGLTWNDMWSGNQTLNDISIPAASVAYICTDAGKVLKGTSLTGINPISSIVPDKFSLSQNYPNPFNPSTKIKFALAKNENVSLTVFDITGKNIQTLVNSNLIAGEYEVDFNAMNLSSGIYYYRLTTGSFVETKKMNLIK